MLTPHMTALARELSLTGQEVHYVTETSLSDDRRDMGWNTGDLSELTIHYIDSAVKASELVDALPHHAIHITQGVRSNGLVAPAQRQIIAKNLRHYPILEQADLRGPLGWAKNLVYRYHFHNLATKVDGILAIGETTASWVRDHSPSTLNVHPFAYFLAGRRETSSTNSTANFRFIYVGNLISRKRVDLLLTALSRFSSQPFELQIVGDGPLRLELEEFSQRHLPGKVEFLGTKVMQEAINHIAAADCLVLPSDHDGWGAVVSEAYINGTPAICTSACGSAVAVKASGCGAVFRKGDADELEICLTRQLAAGNVSGELRESIATWANCLTATAGAKYLLALTDPGTDAQIQPPWVASR